MAESKFSDVDEYGFQRPADFDYHTYAVFMQSYLATLAFRRKKWERFFKTNREWSKPTNKLKRYVRKGVPSPSRGEVWLKTSGAYAKMKKEPGLYSSLINNTQFDKDIVETIKIDLPRTFPDNIYFEEIKHDLFKVLAAYAHHNKDIGYCQGLNYIAGLILIATRNDEWSFWLLKELVENIVPCYHTKTMSGLIVDIDVLVELIKIKVPDVHKHISKLGLPWAVITTKWFICVFAEVLPIETVYRIWDCVFHEGNKILFRVCITLVKLHQDEIMQADDLTGLADVFREMVRNPIVVDCHQFMRYVFTVPGKLKKSQIESIRTQIQNQRNLQRKKSFSRKSFSS